MRLLRTADEEPDEGSGRPIDLQVVKADCLMTVSFICRGLRHLTACGCLSGVLSPDWIIWTRMDGKKSQNMVKVQSLGERTAH